MASVKSTAKAAPSKVSKASATGKPAASAKAATAKPPASKAPTAAPAKAAAEIAEHHHIDKRAADAILTGLVSVLVQHLTSGDRLRIAGLGVLEVKDRPERAGRNPATGEAITIKASKKIAFRPAKELKEAI